MDDNNLSQEELLNHFRRKLLNPFHELDENVLSQLGFSFAEPILPVVLRPSLQMADNNISQEELMRRFKEEILKLSQVFTEEVLQQLDFRFDDPEFTNKCVLKMPELHKRPVRKIISEVCEDYLSYTDKIIVCDDGILFIPKEI